MARRNPRTQQAQALRLLADDLEAGTLAPKLVKKIDEVLEAAVDEEGYEELSREEWERVWAKEIRRRLADYRAGKAKTVDFGTVLAELRARLT
jgi:predicted AAA+ superfamily ATPase